MADRTLEGPDDGSADQERVEADGEHRSGSGSRKELCAAFPRGYLPMPCPGCGRLRLEYGINEEGAVIYVECEKCGRNSDDETLVPGDRAADAVERARGSRVGG